MMTTIFISKMESLPPTSDIKMIDIWLIFCQIFPFVEVVLLTAMEYHREENTELRSEALLVKSASLMEDEGVIAEPNNLRKLYDAVSKFMGANLKTLGRLTFLLEYMCKVGCDKIVKALGQRPPRNGGQQLGLLIFWLNMQSKILIFLLQRNRFFHFW